MSITAEGELTRSPLAPGSVTSVSHIPFGTPRPLIAAFSSDGSLVVTGGEHGELHVFDLDLASRQPRHVLRAHRTEIQALAIRPGSPIGASAECGGRAPRLGFPSRPRDRRGRRRVSLFSVSFSPRDGALAAGGVDRRLTLRDATTFKPVWEFPLRAPAMVGAVAWSRDGRFIAVGDIDDASLSKGSIRMLDAASRAVVATLDTGGRPTFGIAITADSVVVSMFAANCARGKCRPGRGTAPPCPLHLNSPFSPVHPR